MIVKQNFKNSGCSNDFVVAGYTLYLFITSCSLKTIWKNKISTNFPNNMFWLWAELPLIISESNLKNACEHYMTYNAEHRVKGREKSAVGKLPQRGRLTWQLHVSQLLNFEWPRSLITRADCFQDEAGDTPLHDAISGEKHRMVDMLLDSPRLSLTVSNQRGFNYLQQAILKGNKR